MAELKTKLTDASVELFIKSIKDENRRKDSIELNKMMKAITGAKPKMWGSSIVGFGNYQYKYASGREGDWFPIGFSPRKQNLAVYLRGGLDIQADLLKKLGKHKTGKGCLYINKLEDIDADILKKMISRAFAEHQKMDNKQ
jgi:hypothetical protein